MVSMDFVHTSLLVCNVIEVYKPLKILDKYCIANSGEISWSPITNYIYIYII